MLKVAKLSEEPKQSLIPPFGEVNDDDTVDKSLFRAAVQHVTQLKAPTDLKTKKKRIPSSSKPKSPHKVRVILLKKQVTGTQHTKVTMTTTDATKSLVAFEFAGEQVNQPLTAEAEKVLDQNVDEQVKDAEFVAMDEVAEEQSLEIPIVVQLLDEANKLNKVVQETSKSPYDTESEIKVVKSLLTSHISELQDQTMHDSKEIVNIQENSNSDLQSIPDDDLRSISRFEAAEFDDTHKNKVLLDHMDHICEEVGSLHSKLGDMESSIIQQVSAEIKSSLPALVTTALKEQLPGLLLATLKDCLPLIIKESLQTHIPAASEQFAEKQAQLNRKVVKQLNRQFNISHVAQSNRFFTLQKELSKIQDVKDLLESTVVINEIAEGEKKKKVDNSIPAPTQGEHQSAKTIPSFELNVQSQGEQPADLEVSNKESTPPVSDDKTNEGKELVVLNSEEKKSEGTILVEDDSNKDDKQPL
ncbi:hypothetical protein Tco_1501503 [Tanacetum coccineum]